MTADQLRAIFEKKYNRSQWYEVLKGNFNVTTLFEKPVDITHRVKSNPYSAKAWELGNFATLDGHIIGMYEVEVNEKSDITRNRKGLRNLLSQIYSNDVEAALLVFIQGNKWRFSYVSEITVRNKETGKREKKATDPKRYTYLLGEGERAKTAADRFARTKKTEDLFGGGVTLIALEEAFNVEKMSKAFFNEYRKQYGQFTAHITGEDENSKKIKNASPFLKSTFNGDQKAARDFVKKMMGRIVFLYFLEKKGWLGVPADKKWGDGDENFLSNLFKHCKDKKIFYSNVLVPLFFATLNTERKEDLFEIDDKLFTKAGYSKLKIPYLNGGLFEEDDTMTQFLVFPVDLFANLFTFFDQYNFTVYEDSPDEHTVAVDPEMLGHIFENLLEDNKDKGAFYTPKEVVHYMCRESLIEYLYTKLNPKSIETYTELGKQQTALFGNAEKRGQLSFEHKSNSVNELVPRNELEKLVLYHEAADIIEYDDTILKALKEVKICDPAIGSGAFPMGLLMEIFHLVETLYYASPDVTAGVWKFKEGWEPAKVKEEIIQNSIYGVDIEKGAVDIARLRFWLSLVVDEDTPKPLPNLDYKIVVGNSLLSKFEDEVIDIDWSLNTAKATVATRVIITEQAANLNILQSWQTAYFYQKGNKQKLQREIRNKKIDIICNQLTLSKISFQQNYPKLGGFAPTAKEIQRNLENEIKLATFDKVRQRLQAVKCNSSLVLNYFDWKLDFPEVMNEKLVKGNTGFDIVIANPPYGAAVDHNELNLDYTLSKKRLSNTYSYFMEKSLRITKGNGNITLIVPNTWLSITSTKNLRKVFIVENTVKHLLFTHQIFESMADVPPVVDTVVFTCILRRNTSTSVDLITLSENVNIRKRLHEIDNRTWPVVRTTKILEANDFKIQLKDDLFNANPDVFLLEDEGFKKFKVRIGSQEYAVGKGFPALKKDEIKRRIYHSKTKIDKSYLPFVPCGDIQPFNFVWSKTYLKWGDNLHCPRELEIYRNEHILVSRIFDKKNRKLKACYIPKRNSNEAFVNNTDSFNILATSETPYFPLKFILGLVNSKLTGYNLTVSNINLVRKVYPKINTNDLKKIPIPKVVPSGVIDKIIANVEKIEKIKQNELKANSALIESEIDLQIYKLYNLFHFLFHALNHTFGNWVFIHLSPKILFYE